MSEIALPRIQTLKLFEFIVIWDLCIFN